MVLVLVSIALVTVYFRESEGGTLHGAQRIGVSVAATVQPAGERVARPFKDAYGWASDLFGAKSENEKLKKEVEALRSERIANETAAQENAHLKELLAYVDGPRFPEGYSAVTARVRRIGGKRLRSIKATSMAQAVSAISIASVPLWVAAENATSSTRPMRSPWCNVSSRNSRR